MPSVPSLMGMTKRVLVGRPMRSELLGEATLPKKIALPVFASVAIMIIWGFAQIVTGHQLVADSANYQIRDTTNYTGLALGFLLLRAFASGCTALTGVEAISNGVPAFKVPKSKNAATTLALLGGIAVTMFLAITTFAIISHVHTASGPSRLSGVPAGV